MLLIRLPNALAVGNPALLGPRNERSLLKLPTLGLSGEADAGAGGGVRAELLDMDGDGGGGGSGAVKGGVRGGGVRVLALRAAEGDGDGGRGGIGGVSGVEIATGDRDLDTADNGVYADAEESAADSGCGCSAEGTTVLADDAPGDEAETDREGIGGAGDRCLLEGVEGVRNVVAGFTT